MALGTALDVIAFVYVSIGKLLFAKAMLQELLKLAFISLSSFHIVNPIA